MIDAVDSAVVVQIAKCDGGFMILGGLWCEMEFENEDGEMVKGVVKKNRLHVCTNEREVISTIKHYLRQTLANENGVLSE